MGQWRGKLAGLRTLPSGSAFPASVHGLRKGQVLPCEACHTPGLYRDTRGAGWNPFGSQIRWKWLDWLALPLLGLTLVGLLGHGLLRWLGRRMLK